MLPILFFTIFFKIEIFLYIICDEKNHSIKCFFKIFPIFPFPEINNSPSDKSTFVSPREKHLSPYASMIFDNLEKGKGAAYPYFCFEKIGGEFGNKSLYQRS